MVGLYDLSQTSHNAFLDTSKLGIQQNQNLLSAARNQLQREKLAQDEALSLQELGLRREQQAYDEDIRRQQLLINQAQVDNQKYGSLADQIEDQKKQKISIASQEAFRTGNWEEAIRQNPDIAPNLIDLRDKKNESDRNNSLGVMSSLLTAVANGDSKTFIRMFEQNPNALNFLSDIDDDKVAGAAIRLANEDPQGLVRSVVTAFQGLGGDTDTLNVESLERFRGFGGVTTASQQANQRVQTSHDNAPVAQSGVPDPLQEAVDAKAKEEKRVRDLPDSQYAVEQILGRPQDNGNFDFTGRRRKENQFNSGVSKAYNDDVKILTDTQSQINSLNNTIDQVAATEQGGGLLTRYTEILKEWGGKQNESTIARRNFLGNVFKELVNSLPPGVASDRDIELASRGFPTDLANKEQMMEWLTRFRDLNQAKADFLNFKLQYVDQKQGLRGFASASQEYGRIINERRKARDAEAAEAAQAASVGNRFKTGTGVNWGFPSN